MPLDHGDCHAGTDQLAREGWTGLPGADDDCVKSRVMGVLPFQRQRSIGQTKGYSFHRGREAPTTAMVTAIVRTASSQGQFLSHLLANEVLGVPVRPVFIALAAGPLLMLAVRCLRPPQRGREVRRRGEGRGVRGHATWRSLGQLLQQPAIPVRIAERGERVVAGMLGIRPGNSDPPEQVGFVRAGVCATGVVEHAADLHAATDQFFAGCLDVGDNQVQPLGGPGSGRGDVLAEDDRAPGTGRRELDDAEVAIFGGEIGVKPPAQAAVVAASRVRRPRQG